MSDQKQIFEDLENRFSAILEQFDEFQKDYEKQIRIQEELRIPELNRLREHFLYTKDILFCGNIWPMVCEQARFYMEPSLKHMLMAQIRRIEGSSDTIDKILVEFLQAAFINKKYTWDEWIQPDETINLAMQALVLAKEKKISQSQAARDVAKGTRTKKKRIENLIPEVKRALEATNQFPSRDVVDDTD